MLSNPHLGRLSVLMKAGFSLLYQVPSAILLYLQLPSLLSEDPLINLSMGLQISFRYLSCHVFPWNIGT